MPVIQVEQGTAEWLDLRRSHITATDISVIMGSNPFKTQAELFREKFGLVPPQASNAAMERGSRLEPEARAKACEVLGFDFYPVVIVSDDYPWAMASLDGISHLELCDVILEIKCPKEATHIEAIKGRIPEYYRDQMQWQMLVSKAEECSYFSYRPEFTLFPNFVIDVLPDKERQEQMLIKGYEYYQRLCTFDAPKEWKLAMK